MASPRLNLDALKRQAKSLAKEHGTRLHVEQDKLAVVNGFQNWSVMARHQGKLARPGAEHRFVEAVQVRFKGARDAMPPRTVQLVLDRPVETAIFPASGFLIYVNDKGLHIIIARVRVDFAAPADAAEAAAMMEQLLAGARDGRSIVVPAGWPLYSWFVTDNDYLQFVSTLGFWKAEQVLQAIADLTYAQATGFRPPWHDDQLHAGLFGDDTTPEADDGVRDHVLELFANPAFRRGSDGDRLAYRLSRIEAGREHAQAFQQWVADALTVLFPAGLRRVHCQPNGAKAARRDVVATNDGRGQFWQRLLLDYKSRMVVFEAKNYAEPSAADFRQVYAYLGAPHYGKIGFIVTHAPVTTLSQACWEQFRAIYMLDGQGKLVLVVPSALLEELLNGLWLGGRPQPDEVLDRWLDEALLKRLG